MTFKLGVLSDELGKASSIGAVVCFEVSCAREGVMSLKRNSSEKEHSIRVRADVIA